MIGSHCLIPERGLMANPLFSYGPDGRGPVFREAGITCRDDWLMLDRGGVFVYAPIA